MHESNPSFQVPENDAKIWRYMDFTKFVSLLEKKALFFCRLDKQEDQFEGSLTEPDRALHESRIEWLASQGTLDEARAQGLRDFTSDTNRALRGIVAANCWNLREHENSGLWTLYSNRNTGIAIQSTFQRLLESFGRTRRHVYIGKITYIDYQREHFTGNGGNLAPFMHKAKAFEDERELRALILPMPGETEIANGGAYVDVDVSRLVQTIYLAPKARPFFSDALRSVVNKFDFTFDIRESGLSKDAAF